MCNCCWLHATTEPGLTFAPVGILTVQTTSNEWGCIFRLFVFIYSAVACLNCPTLYCRTHYIRVLTLSMLNRAWYWGTTALRGSVKIRTSVSSSKLCRGTTTGRRPTNSGIIPNSMRSLASTCFRSRSFSSISATVSVSPLVLAKSAAAAARRPFPRLEGVPKPKY